MGDLMSEYPPEFCPVYVCVLSAKERTILSYGAVGGAKEGIAVLQKDQEETLWIYPHLSSEPFSLITSPRVDNLLFLIRERIFMYAHIFLHMHTHI